MADRQHEAVTVGPDRMSGIEAQKALPQTINHRRERHRRSRMTGVRLLHRIHRQSADGVNAQFIHFVSMFIIRHGSHKFSCRLYSIAATHRRGAEDAEKKTS